MIGQIYELHMTLILKVNRSAQPLQHLLWSTSEHAQCMEKMFHMSSELQMKSERACSPSRLCHVIEHAWAVVQLLPLRWHEH